MTKIANLILRFLPAAMWVIAAMTAGFYTISFVLDQTLEDRGSFSHVIFVAAFGLVTIFAVAMAVKEYFAGRKSSAPLDVIKGLFAPLPKPHVTLKHFPPNENQTQSVRHFLALLKSRQVLGEHDATESMMLSYGDWSDGDVDIDTVISFLSECERATASFANATFIHFHVEHELDDALALVRQLSRMAQVAITDIELNSIQTNKKWDGRAELLFSYLDGSHRFEFDLPVKDPPVELIEQLVAYLEDLMGDRQFAIAGADGTMMLTTLAQHDMAEINKQMDGNVFAKAF